MDILQRARLFFWLFIAMVVLNVGVLATVWFTMDGRGDEAPPPSTWMGSPMWDRMPALSPEQQAQMRARMGELFSRGGALRGIGIDSLDVLRSLRQGEDGRILLAERALLRSLELDEQQMTEIRRRRTEHLREAREVERELLRLRRTLLSTLAQEDPAETSAVLDTLTRTLSTSEALKLEHLRDVRSLLTDGQKERFDTLLPLTLLGANEMRVGGGPPGRPMPPMDGMATPPGRRLRQGEPRR